MMESNKKTCTIILDSIITAASTNYISISSPSFRMFCVSAIIDNDWIDNHVMSSLPYSTAVQLTRTSCQRRTQYVEEEEAEPPNKTPNTCKYIIWTNWNRRCGESEREWQWNSRALPITTQIQRTANRSRLMVEIEFYSIWLFVQTIRIETTGLGQRGLELYTASSAATSQQQTGW